MEKTTTISTGLRYEDLALQHLQKNGLQLIERNYQCRFGEIDLIMRQKRPSMLVFVEVRYRKSRQFGGAISSITTTKQRRIALTASDYLQRSRDRRSSCRFDVIAISGATADVEWIAAAFDSPI